MVVDVVVVVVACAMGKSSRGEEMAERAASTARVFPLPRPMPISAGTRQREEGVDYQRWLIRRSRGL